MGISSADTGIDFATLVRPSTPNSYLVCPKGLCTAPLDEESSVYGISAGQFFELVHATLLAQPRAQVAQNQPELRRLVLIQRSLVFRFPDTITVQVFAQPDGRSTLAMYSRSNYGRSDLGVNRRRVRHWLALIAAAAAGGGRG
jgi:uncharacterized protein (DUF1499 family)